MNTLWIVLKYLALSFCGLVTIILVSGFFLVGRHATSCNEDSEAVLYARTLGKERLAELYYDMEALSEKPGFEFYELQTDDDGLFPEPFADIKALRIRPGEENIMLNGCLDHYVYLHFYGFGSNKTYNPERQIVLSWGEYASAGNEVVWVE